VCRASCEPISCASPTPAIATRSARWNTRAILLGLLDALGAWAVVEYRFRRWVRTSSSPARLLLRPVAMVSRKTIEIIAGISISPDADIGPGFFIAHFGGVFVGPGVVAGPNLTLSQGVTIGIEKGAGPEGLAGRR
jgi:serine O-acetyltransferase